MLLLILFIGIMLIVLNVKAISKEKKDFNNIFEDKYNNLDDFSIEIGKLRNEFGETIYELQQEILDLKRELNIYKKENGKILNEGNLLKNIDENDLKEHHFEEEKVENKFQDDLDNEVEDNVFNESNENAIDHVYSEIDFDNYNDDNVIKEEPEVQNNFEKSEEINKSSVKYNEISDLLKQGFSVDEISEKLNMGKGEVLLIIELYLK